VSDRDPARFAERRATAGSPLPFSPLALPGKELLGSGQLLRRSVCCSELKFRAARSGNRCRRAVRLLPPFNRRTSRRPLDATRTLILRGEWSRSTTGFHNDFYQRLGASGHLAFGTLNVEQ
jgi:hypothetical protein